MLVTGAGVHHRQHHPARCRLDVIDDDIKQVWQSAAARSERALRPPARQHRPCCSCAASRPAMASDPCCATSTSNSRRARSSPCSARTAPARDAVEGDQRRGRGRPRRDRARRARHHARPTERDRRARHRADARRQGRVRFADRAGEPANCPDGPTGATRPASRQRSRRPSRHSRSSANDSTPPAADLSAAASSRCWRWEWLHQASRGCC